MLSRSLCVILFVHAIKLISAYPECSGYLEDHVIDFETNAYLRPFRAGDTPKKLQDEVTIGGRRNNKPSGGNDLVIFDSANPTGGDDDLGTETEGMVLILNNNNNKTIPNDSRFGGQMFFRFQEPVFQVKEVRFIDVQRPGQMTAFTRQMRHKRREDIPRHKNGVMFSVFPRSFFDIKRVRVSLESAGAIAALHYTRCIESAEASACPEDQELAEDGVTCRVKAMWKQVGSDLPGSSLGNIGHAARLSDDGSTIVSGNGDFTTVYQRNASSPLGWTEKGSIIEEAGAVVDISRDGSLIAVNGDPFNCDTIQAYLFDPEINDWKLVNDGGQAIFAQELSMSADGKILVVGSIDFGLVGVFRLEDDQWLMLGSSYIESGGSGFGDFGGYQTCSADGKMFAIANTGDSDGAGSITVYKVNNSTTDYTPLGTSLVGNSDFTRAGSSMALSANGTVIAFTSGLPFGNLPAFTPSQVDVYYYNEEQSSWDPLGQPLEGPVGEEFGDSLALSDDGSMLAVGIPGANNQTGKAQLYRLVEDEWIQVGPELVGEREHHRFGTVSLSGDGRVVGVGSPTTGILGIDGEVEVWELSGSDV